MKKNILFSLGNKKYSTNKKFSKKIGALIPTKNRPEVLKKHLSSLGESYVAAGMDIIILDSSENDLVKNLCEELNKRLKLNIIYEKYVDKDFKSLDIKVLEGIRKYAPNYEYFWILRDRMGYIVNEIIDDFNSKLNENYDLIVVNNTNDDILPNRECVNNPKEFFKLNFNNMTVLGKIVYKSDFLIKVIDANPLDEKNYTLALPVLIFQYICNAPFKAYSIIRDCIICTSEQTKSSFWMSFFLYQMVERYSCIFRNLHGIYQSEIEYVINEFNEKFGLFKRKILYTAAHYDSYTLEYVRKLKDDINYISKTPYIDFEKFAIAK